jgi:hypothetical protein
MQINQGDLSAKLEKFATLYLEGQGYDESDFINQNPVGNADEHISGFEITTQADIDGIKTQVSKAFFEAGLSAADVPAVEGALEEYPALRHYVAMELAK